MASASGLGLAESEPQPGGTFLYRVPRLLRPLLEADRPADPAATSDAAASALFRLWWEGDYQHSEAEALEIARLGREAHRLEIVAPVTDSIGRSWIDRHRYQEAHSLYTQALSAVGRDYRLVGGLAEVELMLGDGPSGDGLLQESLDGCPDEDERGRLRLANAYPSRLIQHGQPDEALVVLREQQLPAADRLENEHARAVTMGRIADVLQPRGEAEEALRLLREECLPTFRRLREPRSLIQILLRPGMISLARGEMEDAVRCLGEAFELAGRFGDKETLEMLRPLFGDEEPPTAQE